MKLTINVSKFCLSKYHVHFICQSFSPINILLSIWYKHKLCTYTYVHTCGYDTCSINNVFFLQVNTFQCVLATSELESFVMFLYADLQWTTGDVSNGNDGLGGAEALAGYNAGDQINSYTLPGSLTSRITNIARTSNVGTPGTWIFKVGQGTEL